MQFTLDSNIKVLKWAFIKQATTVIDGILIAWLPFMATPVFKQLMDLGISAVIKEVVTKEEMLAFFAYTDLRVSAQGRAFIADAERHEQMLKSGSPAEIAASEESLFHSFRTLAMVTT